MKKPIISIVNTISGENKDIEAQVFTLSMEAPLSGDMATLFTSQPKSSIDKYRSSRANGTTSPTSI
ncbi:MAG: hypothetical protein HQK65_22530 [Desulfamplus sp.]|nr:hypothetical protein [Desulfamplus sp.]